MILMLAKALYDNIADTTDEITFHRGDVVTVLDQDYQGLDGWWLCSLRGKKGIAPGNRLKLLGSYFDNAAAVYHTPTASPSPNPNTNANPQWNRRSWHQLPNKVITPHKVGDVYIYDQPNRSYQEYDVPPSRYFPSRNTPPPRTPPCQDNEGNYDTPPRSRVGSQEVPSLIYDTPPSSRVMSQEVPRILCNSPSPIKTGMCEGELYDVPPQTHVPVGVYDMPHSNRSSTISNRSTGSTMTMSSSASNHSFPFGGFSSAPPSTCGSARSSIEISAQDIYDVPPAPHPVGLAKRGSIDSALDIYDIPTNSKKEISNKHYIEDYDIPKGDRKVSSCSEKQDVPLKNLVNKNESNDIYDVPQSNKPKLIDETDNADDVYDVPSSNALVIGSTNCSFDDRDEQKSMQGVYDIPPQVTRDTVTARVDSGVVADIDHRLSTCSMDSRGSGGEMPAIPYDELPLELDAAMDLLVKLQQDVHTSTTRFLSFVSSTWRKRENLEPRLYEIKLICMAIKTSVQELIDFAQGALANSAKAEDKKLAQKLSKHLQPLQDAQQILIKSLINLGHIGWDVSKLEKSSVEGQSDDLDQIIVQSKELSPDARALATLIQGNSTLLFKRSQKLEHGSSLPGTLSKPPVKPKPKWTPGKAVDRNSIMQERPLPAPPASERPLPPTPLKQLQQLPVPPPETDKVESDQQESSPAMKRRSVCRENVLDDEDDDNIYENDSNYWLDDYDYVALESNEEPKGKRKQVDGIMPSGNHPGTQQPIESRIDTAETKQSSISREQSPCAKEPSPNKDTSYPASDLGSECTSSDDYAGYTEPVDPSQIMSNIAADESADPSVNDLQPPVVHKIGLSPKFKEKMEKLQEDSKQQVQTNVEDFVAPVTRSDTCLVESDRQLLFFYSEQIDTHTQLLTNATDTFFSCVEYNQPPKVFIANSKFVVLAAHKLVFIADTLYRNIVNDDISTKIMHCANYLCECLKLTVTATKNAALNYPAVGVVQEMVDRVVDVSHAANELKLVTFQAAKL